MTKSGFGKALAAGLSALLAISLAACGSDTPAPQTAAAPAPVSAASAPAERPNILLIVVDDMGYTDIGAYGGEIHTPNLDALAAEGVMLRDFQTKAVCGPTRASLMSGTTFHNAGGAMHQTPNQIGQPGYEAYLNQDVVAFPTLLQRGGYNTYMAGKWHLGREPHQLPIARGFDRSFTLMEGGASHYEDARGMFVFQREGVWIENDTRVEQLPEGFYSSTFLTDYIIESIDADADSGKPWFSYLAYTAPHWPLHAPLEYIEKYNGVYDAGYEVLREQRIARAKELGVFPADAPMYPRLSFVAPWDSLTDEQKAFESRKMQIHAAMVELVDENVGRLVAHLKATGQYENTFIMFMGDNGAEGQMRLPGDNGTDWVHDNSIENIGLIGSNVAIGPGWAQATSGVLRYYKSVSAEAGTRTPAFFHYPGMSKQGVSSGAFVTVEDVAPTFLELAGISYPVHGDDGRILPELQGLSLVPMLLGDAESVRGDDFDWGFEVFGHRAVRKGDWKLLWLTSEPGELGQRPVDATDAWQLFNLASDPGETHNLADSEPEKLAELQAIWDQFVNENGVILPVR